MRRPAFDPVTLVVAWPFICFRFALRSFLTSPFENFSFSVRVFRFGIRKPFAAEMPLPRTARRPLHAPSLRRQLTFTFAMPLLFTLIRADEMRAAASVEPQPSTRSANFEVRDAPLWPLKVAST